MKNIAIIFSGEGAAALKVAELFKDNDSLRVKIAVTDRENAPATESLQTFGIPVVYLPREKWRETPSELMTFLATNEIALIAVDDFRGMMPEDVSEVYRNRTVILDSPDEAPTKLIEALRVLIEDENAPDVPKPDVPKSVDEEWAETLKMSFDPERLRQTPPPIPGVNPVDNGQTSTLNNTVDNQQTVQQTYGSQQYYSPYPQVDNPDEERPAMPSTYLIWSILTTVLCCVIPGIIAIIYSSQVSTKYYCGDYEGAKKASDRAQIWIIASFVLGVLSATLYLPIMLIMPS